MKVFKPNFYSKNIFEINYNKLKEKNIKLLIFDLDNTIGKINEKIIRPDYKDFLINLSKDFDILICSNNTYKRVSAFLGDSNLNFISNSLKPTGKIYRFLKKNYKYNKNEICFIGDQIVTDIFVGNRGNYCSILVDPIAKKDLKITYFNRVLERLIKRINKFKDGEYYEED